METRSRKRAEVTSSAPSSSPVTSAAATPSLAVSTKMDSTNESSGSGNRGGRRGRNNPAEKGKEKEHEVRVRFRDNLTFANISLQGLLRKLGSGLDDLLPSSAIDASSSQQNGKLKKILSGLKRDGEEGKQVEALTQLCEMLSIGTEESLSLLSMDSFVPVLVELLNRESNPDIVFLATQAFTYICHTFPSSCAEVVFPSPSLTIEPMELAEQSLQALKKISLQHPTACLRAGALMAVLSYLDVFSTRVQLVALSIAANMCKKIPSDAADFVMEAVPLLTNLLQYHNAKVLEHASICLIQIVEAFASCPDRLDELCNHGLVTQAASLISTSNSGGGQASLSSSTYTGLIRLISTFASGSSLGAKSLLLLGISGILKDILSGSGMVANMSISPALSRPPEQILEIVNLANELLPPLPQGTVSLPSSTNLLIKGSFSRKSSKHEDTNGSTDEISAREKLLNDQPELLQQFGVDLLPVMVQIYGSGVNSPVPNRCLSIIGKLMYFSSSDMIQTLMKVTNISSFLADVLAWKDPQVLIPALQIADILMGKLPGTFTKMFVREGVIHAVDVLILGGSRIASPAEKDSDSVSKTASRSRRSQRSKPDLHGTDDSKIPVSTVGSPSNSVEHPTGNLSMRVIVSASAKAFKDKYFPSAPGSSEVGITDDFVHLKNLCLKLSSGVDDQSKSKGKSEAFASSSLSDIPSIKEENLIVVVSEMLSELSKGDGVSTFEFIGSGVVSALLNYFSCGYFSKDRISEANLSVLRQQVIQRYKAFITISLPTSLDEGRVAPMSVLVQKLQNALASMEIFPVVLSHSTPSSGGSARLSCSFSFRQTFKLRLCRAQGEKLLRDYSCNVVRIDPLASLAAVEDFLWPRVQRNDSSQNPSLSANKSESKSIPTGASASNPSSDGRRHSNRSITSVNIGETTKMDLSQEKKAGSSKGKGKAVLKPGSEDPKGPQTRNVRRRAALDRDIQMKHTSGDTTSIDDEPDVSLIDMNDALVIDDYDLVIEDDDHDDVLFDHSFPVCMSNGVHDVKLGDPNEENSTVPATSDSKTNPAPGSSSRVGAAKNFDSTKFRSSNSFRSRGAMSFAAASMAGLASANGRGIRGERDRLGRPLFGSNDPPRLVFYAGGKQLNKNLTIYQAIQRHLVVDEAEDERFTSNDFISSDGNRFWSDVYTITYQRADNQNDKDPAGTSNSLSASKSSNVSSTSNAEPPHCVSLLDSILQGELPCDLEKSNSIYNILALLRVLEGLNQLSPRLRVQALMDSYSEGKIANLDILVVTGVRIPGEEFINSKLTLKLSRQIQDALSLCSGSLPAWCSQLTKSCPFLFPFEIRRQYLYSTAFGLSRALHRLQQQGVDGHGSSNEREVRVGRLKRQKFRVSRNRILDSAAKILELYSSQKTVLEVEYFGEVGTGLGPTLEFYTLLSHDLQKASLGMWRSSFQPNKPPPMEVTDIAHSQLGLFPRPWAPNSNTSDGSQFSKVVEHFRLLGRVMAKALLDGRLLDFSFSTAFYKLVLGQELDLYDLLSFDAELGRNLQELQTLVSRKHLLESSSSLTNEDTMSLHFRGVPVEDLCLDFTLPGHSDYVLKSGEETVDIDSLEEYISLVVDATVKTGITRQMEAFRAGFNQVFDISSLQIFSPHELDYLLCGQRELWKAETLVEHIKFDHGYTAKSPAIVNLLEIMGEFTPEHQRSFCQFVTGAPRLPPGGLAVLSPKLTIVRKHSSVAGNALSSGGNGAFETADDDLPSVTTCANYLKLPPYSTKEIMYKKLLYAINEGQGSFDLS
ncbi:E3 ubiquitin-protein ligase UPL3-like isoform X2 [Impatiens glandulifera]|uniref:E3 ubiquitin-protein ligase UPL3-like isoform X2 n=1 Tax=Impatiens glandulifera TaxID=253017 RepID=UPI001FB155AB|nr:E3 ubiquitin-protein ligase UPL3-like isoform X2 [Impatiens glandulifera]